MGLRLLGPLLLPPMLKGDSNQAPLGMCVLPRGFYLFLFCIGDMHVSFSFVCMLGCFLFWTEWMPRMVGSVLIRTVAAVSHAIGRRQPGPSRFVPCHGACTWFLVILCRSCNCVFVFVSFVLFCCLFCRSFACLLVHCKATCPCIQPRWLLP